MDNPERHWQHCGHKTQDEDKQNTKTQHNTEKLNDEQTRHQPSYKIYIFLIKLT